MINQLIQVLNQANASRMMVTVQKTLSGEYALVVNTEFESELPKTPAGDDLRKALSVPLVVRGEAEQLEAVWSDNFEEYLQIQSEVSGAVSNIKTFEVPKTTPAKPKSTAKSESPQKATESESEPSKEAVEQNFTLDFEEPESL